MKLMLQREGLFDRTFSVLAVIRHQNNSTKLTKKKESCVLKATWTAVEWINFWYVPADSTFCIHLDVHVKDEKTHFSIQFVRI